MSLLQPSETHPRQDLGLHRDSNDIKIADPQAIDLRRRIFWSAYCMDRSICLALQRPVSIEDAAISTKFPPTSTHSNAAEPFMGLIHYHQLQSEMIQVHFQGHPLPKGMSWEDWLSKMEHKLRIWYERSRHEASSDELVEFALARGLSILHRPSPKILMPSERSLLVAFEAASSSARSLHEHIQSGFFRRPWLSAHHTLETALIVLFCLRHGCSHIGEKYNASRIFEMTKLFTTNFLDIAAQGWPEVSKYAGIYERLLGPLLESVFSGSTSPESHFGSAQDAELTSLLYPGPAQLDKLRFGTKRDEDFASFDFTLFDVHGPFLEFNTPQPNFNTTTDFLAGFDLLDHVMGIDDITLGM
jgi:hypothetical protein